MTIKGLDAIDKNFAVQTSIQKVDNTHPTDSGFLSMAFALQDVFKEILK